MDQTKPYQGEIAAAIPMEVPPKDDSTVNVWVTRVIMVTLQVIVAISIFQLFRDIDFCSWQRCQLEHLPEHSWVAPWRPFAPT